MDKARKQERMKQYQEEQRAKFLASLPMPVEGFIALFDYLDALDEECEGDLRSTISFFRAKPLSCGQGSGLAAA